MTKPKVLVLGATGPAGICLLRELAYRKHAAVIFARNISKLPKDLASNPEFECIQGEMSDAKTFSIAMSLCSVVISLLGPSIHDRGIGPRVYADIYESVVFPAMHRHSVRRIFVMGTISIQQPEDRWTLMQSTTVVFMKLFAGAIYQNMLNLRDVFELQGKDLDWTVFRIAQIPGESDETSWKSDREDGKAYTGWIGEKGWTSSIKRAALARWLVDSMKSDLRDWVRKMPAVSKSGS